MEGGKEGRGGESSFGMLRWMRKRAKEVKAFIRLSVIL